MATNLTQKIVMSLPEKITERHSGGTGEYNTFSLNAGKGDIFLSEPITPETAVHFSSVMKHMHSKELPVNIYINSPGGEINSGLVIYDIIQAYPYEINLYCTGIAASMSAVILAGGRKGHRFVLPHSTVMIHEPRLIDGFGDSATTIEKKAQDILAVKNMVNGILAKHTGRTMDEINEATAFDNYMNAEDAVKFGICDEIKNIF